MQLRANGTPPKHFATFEHLVRRCEGGAGIPNNVVLACRVCNNERHHGDIDLRAYPTEGPGWSLGT